MRKFSGLLLILCVAFLSALPACADNTIPAGFKGSFVDVQGQQLRVYQTGSGPDLLLIHGLPGSIEDWETVIPDLSKNFRVTAYDRPGQGFSSANKLKYDLNQNADIAIALIEKLKLNNPVVVGHSYGGSTVVAMAERNPSNVRAFVAVSAVTTGEGETETIFRILKTPVIGPVFAWLAKLFTGCSMVEDGGREAFSPNEDVMPADYVETRCMIFMQPKVIKTMSMEDVSMRPDVGKIASLYGGIKKPLFIVHGRSDKVVPVTDAILLNNAATGSKLILLDNTGHMVQYARPAELIQVIEEASH
jgi:pimeloyl-ACP methyl ester carboxylesterase